MATKELLINSIRQIRIQGGNATIPTSVLYKDSKCYIGLEAVDNCDRPTDLREDFKVDLGAADPIRLAKRESDKGAVGRSTLGIAKDFIEAIISQALVQVERQGSGHPTRILIAEPLSLAGDQLASEEWLKNYRVSLRRILQTKFAEVDFMPEPFAVFQYYRYGFRHPLVAQRIKHIALVFDFGGGTFDASIIETTAAGDVSEGGRNQRPLAAKSIPIGGFYINQMIARALLFRALDKSVEKSSVSRALDAFSTLKNASDELLAQHRADHANFVRNFRRLLMSVEQAKLFVSSEMISWALDADISKSPACTVDVPLKPLSENSPLGSLRLEAAEFRSIFEERIWKQQLLPAIRETLKRAESELGGKPISIVLLSGGSANIRWLKRLLERDVSEPLRQAEVLELSENFQEIVAKGLAVECARRYYTEGQGDFRAVTYNRLCLGLSPNGGSLERRKFLPISAALEGIETEAGVLLPSSTSMQRLIGTPLRWKVRLSRPPTQRLDYYFMRSSFDPEEVNSRHNIEHSAPTPHGTTFGQGFEVELIVRDDGTAEPSFIYGHGSKGRSITVRGKPFYLDMTYAPEEGGNDTYIGFDFGSSTSSICYVDARDIRAYSDRAKDKEWQNLSALVEYLPYPAAYPLARFISETDAQRMDAAGREALEGMLTLAAYITFLEQCTPHNGDPAAFSSFRQRSAGPLWDLFQRSAKTNCGKFLFCKELLALVTEPRKSEIDNAVSSSAAGKHGKCRASIDYPRVLEMLGNTMRMALNGKVIGYFEDIRCKPFSMNQYQGVFRSIAGQAPPFIGVYDYEGTENFPSEFLFCVDQKSNTALPLFPLLVGGLERSPSYRHEPDIYMFDIIRGSRISFRAIRGGEELSISNEAFPDLDAGLQKLYGKTFQCLVSPNIRLTKKSVG
jgi:molecular chaperone DnaK (HSP70)